MIYRIGFIILALAAVALGLVVGTLNADPVSVDLLWVQIRWPLGLVMLVSLVLGFAIGLVIMWLGSVIPLRMRIRKLRSEGAIARSNNLDSGHD